MSARFRDRERQPARRTPNRPARRRLLVVCEGQRTEPEYVRGLAAAARNPLVDVEIAREHGDPKRVVEAAKARASSAAADARRRHDRFLGYDEVWCLFDRDEHPRFDAAVDQARANDFALAVSNPCFELWLLLHFRESPGDRHRHDVQELLGKEVPGYAKEVAFATYAPRVADACLRAQRLDEGAAAMGELGRNPTTGVYRLVASIRR